MRRTDRLFELILILRDGRLHTARALAERLEVSTRTIWRDMDTLVASGLPVRGERGVGYLLTEPITLPPLSLSLDEREALQLGVAMVAQAADPELQSAARSLMAKIEAVLPPSRRGEAPQPVMAVFPLIEAARGFAHMPPLRQAIKAGRKVALDYRSLDDVVSRRTVRPLQMDYWGRVWTLTGWCELRSDFRTFRIDRIEAVSVLDEGFSDEPGKTLADYLDRYARGPDGN